MEIPRRLVQLGERCPGEPSFWPHRQKNMPGHGASNAERSAVHSSFSLATSRKAAAALTHLRQPNLEGSD